MDKTLAGLIGAVGALVAAGQAHAASGAPPKLDEAMQARSYADLLKPIPNALAVMQEAAAAQAGTDNAVPEGAADPAIRTVQYDHHHHHHHYTRRRYHHHHHHHGYY